MRILTGKRKKFLAQFDAAKTYQPLDVLKIRLPESGVVSVRDARGEEYFREKVAGEISVTISGALGNHFIDWMEKDGQVRAHAVIRVDCETSIVDEGSFWERFHKKLYWNLHTFDGDRRFDAVRYQGGTYFLLSPWLRENINIMKGKRYYYPRLKDALDIFAATQSDEGMIYDFYMDYSGPETEKSRFRNRKFTKFLRSEKKYMERFPIENDLEFLFVQGIYLAWKATGDTPWMIAKLANAEKALQYNLQSEYCWSKKHNLIKRSLSIDTWDFAPIDMAWICDGDGTEVIPGKTPFGIFHGDNTGFAQSCGYLAEMYAVVGESSKADHWRGIAKQIREQLDKVSWNGKFFTHWVPEDESFVGDYGVDMKAQVSLGNTHALNRGISHEQALAIVETYLDIKKNMDPTAPAEFYSIYPPFETGFSFLRWHYFNGGVWPFVGGELAHGAFEHGHEKYGVDILQRLDQLLAKYNDRVPTFWTGKIEPEPARKFTPIDLSMVANADIAGIGARGVPGWEGRGIDNDFSHMPVGRQSYFNVPFSIVDPSVHGRRCCIGMAAKKGYFTECIVDVNGKAASIYFLHTGTFLRRNQLAGWIDILYADGTTHRKYVESDHQLKNWWRPADIPYSLVEGWVCRVAYQGENHQTLVGNYIWGYNNPHPEKEIRSIKFVYSKTSNHFWFIFGVTLSDAPVWFEAKPMLPGRFYNWNAAGMIYGLMEGLCGVYDAGVSFDKAILAPRWAATDSSQVKVFVKYPESQGYVAYNYIREKSRIILDFTTAAEEVTLKVLLPENEKVGAVLLDEVPAPFTLETIEKSHYVVLRASDIRAKKLSIELKSARATRS